MENNKSHELERLLNNAMQVGVYRGCICEKLVGGWRCLGTKVKTPQEIDAIIDASLKNLENSLK